MSNQQLADHLLFEHLQCDIIDLLEKNSNLRKVLADCADYFDQRADVSDSEDGPVANEEMRLLTAIKAVL